MRGSHLLAMSLLILVLVGCQSLLPAPATVPTQTTVEPAANPGGNAPTAQIPPASDSPTEEIVLDVAGIDGSTKSFTMADLYAQPAITDWGGMMSSTGRITAPAMTTGVKLLDLVSAIGPFDSGMAVRVVAEDGYAMTISYDQIVAGSFTTYDPGTGKERPTTEPLQVAVVYAKEGQPLPATEEGTLRLGLLNGDKMQVTDGHWWVKWVRKLQVISLAEEWSLQLEGAISETMDRNTFESCASPSCHGASWTDDRAQVWNGVPLYLLAGRVDDENPHEGAAFNRDLSDSGYLIELIAADGYTVTLESQAVQENKNILLAHLANEVPLDEKYFPLRLVGEGLKSSQMAGQIEEIVLHQPTVAEATPTAVPTPDVEPTLVVLTADGILSIGGAVANPQSWDSEALSSMAIADIQAEHPKKGMQSYQGIRLTALLALAAPSADAKTVSLIAADGYSTDVPLADVLSCADCIVAFGDDSTMNAVMPGFESSAWVKSVTLLEIK